MSADQLRSKIEELVVRAGMARVSRRTLWVAASLCAVAVAIAAWRWWPAPSGRVLAQGVAAGSPATLAPAETSEATSAERVVVHVAGAVRHPGVYELEKGSRVVDAVADAGGVLPDAHTEAINLARVVEDGEQLLIPDEDDVAAAHQAAGASRAGVTGTGSQVGSQIDINSADVTMLDTLPGVGPSTAAKIVAEREANGRFDSVEELSRVPGIGPKRLEALRDLVCAR